MPIQQSGYSDLGVEVENLGRIYKIRGGKKRRTAPKELLALQGVNPRVKQGELFGLLGPNGAGKTTLILHLSLLRLPRASKD